MVRSLFSAHRQPWPVPGFALSPLFLQDAKLSKLSPKFSPKFCVEARGMEAVIPPRSHRKDPLAVDWCVYKERHLIECFLNKIKHYRRIF